MTFNEIFRKNVTCDITKSHKKSDLQPFSRKLNIRETTLGESN